MHHTCLFSFLTLSLSHALLYDCVSYHQLLFVTLQGELIDPVPESCRFPRRWKSAWEYSCQPRLSHVSEHRPGVAERWERPRCTSTYLNFFFPLFQSHRDAALHERGKKQTRVCVQCVISHVLAIVLKQTVKVRGACVCV